MLRITTSLLLVIISHTLIAQDKWVELYVSTTFEIQAKSGRDTISLPFKLLPPVKVKDVTIKDGRFAYVHVNNRFESSYLRNFRVYVDTGLHAVNVIVDVSKVRRAASYQAMLVLQSGTRPEEKLMLTFVRPAAVLDTIQTIKIEIDGFDITSSPLMVKEKSMNSDIQALGIIPPAVRGFPDKSPISFDSSVKKLAAGQWIQLKYTLEANRWDFPLGKTKTTMQVTAPELATPFSMPIEIRRNRWKGFIVVLLFLGVALGTTVRVYLNNKKDLDEKTQQALTYIEKIATELEGIKDKTFTGDVAKVLDDLSSALVINKSALLLKAEDLAKLDTAIKKAETDYNKVKQEFEDQLKAVSVKVSSLDYIFKHPDFSARMLAHLTPARSSYESLLKELKEKNKSEAERLVSGIVRDLKTFVTSCKTRIAQILSDIETGKTIPANTIANPTVVDITSRVGLIKSEIQSHADPGEIPAIFDTLYWLNTVDNNLKNILEYIKTGVAQAYHGLYQDDGTKPMVDLKKAFDQWVTNMDMLIDNPLSDVMMGGAALTLTTALANASAVTQNTVQGGGIAGGPMPQYSQALAGNKIHSIDSPLFSLPDLRARIQDVNRSWFWTTVTRGIILFLLMAFAAYKFYAPSFVGTWEEMAGIFLSAFTLDVTVDNVISFRDKKR